MVQSITAYQILRGYGMNSVTPFLQGDLKGVIQCPVPKRGPSGLVLPEMFAREEQILSMEEELKTIGGILWKATTRAGGRNDA